MQRLPAAVDVNADPRVFETTLVAMEAQVDLNGDGSPESVYTYNGTVPSPEFRVTVGDTVIVHFQNLLPKPSSIHWHGVEVNNASDGTPVTQNAVLTGDTYTYKFIVTRPGVFWYHPHFKPTNDEFKGQYGSFIVEDPHEKILRRLGVLPKPRHTMTLLLGDTTICKSEGQNDTETFPADPDLPWAGPGSFPGNDDAPAPVNLCEKPLDDVGMPLGTGALPAGTIPNVQPADTCGDSGDAVRLTGIAFAPDAIPGSSLLYGIDSRGTLYQVLPMSAETVEIGSTGFSGTHGLGFDPLTERLWSGSSSSRQLISIDPRTALARVELPFDGFPDEDTRDFAFLPDGTLYIVGHSPGSFSGTRIYTVNRGSGDATQVLSGGQGIAASSPSTLLQSTSRFFSIDTTIHPPLRTVLPGWSPIPQATQLTLDPATNLAYGINGCVMLCTGEIYRYDLDEQTATLIGTPGPTGCNANEGQLVVTNGRVTAGRAGSPELPGDVAEGPAVFDVKPGSGVRLQIVNTAVSRYFRLRMTDSEGRQVMLYRVGGEGGLLDRVRLEGGAQGNFDTKYERGEILLAPSTRADVVLVVPDGRRGDVATLWTLDYRHTRRGFARVPTVPVVHLRNLGNGPRRQRFVIEPGDGLLVRREIDDPVEDLESLPLTGALLDPSLFPDPLPGSADPEIHLTTTDGRPSIDGIIGAFPGQPSHFEKLPHIESSRYARVGDLLELQVTNATGMHHPFHLHGFSFQPVRIEDQTGRTIMSLDYNEFVDTVDIQPRHTLVFRVRLDDRTLMDGLTPGGAEGRWVFHCHIFFHSGLGMISELVVLP
jgi:FtsP/CotA-like multicopper oxidase with cupredoxin domain